MIGSVMLSDGWTPYTNQDAGGEHVYVLLLGESAVYVGSTGSLRERISIHRRDKEFDRVFVRGTPPGESHALEVQTIRALQPQLNVRSRSVSERQTMNENNKDIRIAVRISRRAAENYRKAAQAKGYRKLGPWLRSLADNVVGADARGKKAAR